MAIATRDFYNERGLIATRSAQYDADGIGSEYPFAKTNAENETGRLAGYFVNIEWFDWLLGDTRDPMSLILFAPRGHGKTSHRLQLEHIASRRRGAPALVVTINDFTALAKPIDIDSYIAELRRQVLAALAKQVLQQPARGAQLAAHAELQARFYALLKLYHREALIGRSIPAAPDIETFVTIYANEQRGASIWLRELVELCGSLGYVSIYCLLDGVDELPETGNSPESMLRVVSPLLNMPGLLQSCGVAFKFFLPDDLKKIMLATNEGRLDRIPHRALAWSDTQLRDMIGRRLSSFQQASGRPALQPLRSFADLCELGFDADGMLIHAAGRSPRRLIELAGLVVEAHCRQCDDLEQSISRAVLEQTLREASAVVAPPVIAQRAAVDTPAPAPDGADAPAQPTGQRLISVDPTGDIRFDGALSGIKLTKMLRLLLDYLWQHRDRSVTYDELQKVLYSEDFELRGDPRGSLEKLVRRLRQAIEPNEKNSHHYIENQAGIGFVLRNYRD